MFRETTYKHGTRCVCVSIPLAIKVQTVPELCSAAQSERSGHVQRIKRHVHILKCSFSIIVNSISCIYFGSLANVKARGGNYAHLMSMHDSGFKRHIIKAFPVSLHAFMSVGMRI